MFDKLKNLGSIFVESDDPKAEKPSPVQPAAPAPKVTTLPAGELLVDAPTLVDTAAEEAKIEEKIQSHPDFARAANFLKVVESMKAVIPDEATRIRAAQAASGIDPTDLVTTIKSAIPVIEQAKADFESSFVSAKSAEIEQSKQMSAEVQAEIDKMTQHLGDLSTQKGQIDQHVRDSSVALDKAKIDHKSITDLVSERYTTLASKLAKYLGVANGQ